MNNGLSTSGKRRREMLKRIYGTPKERARRIIGNHSYTYWVYRGISIEGRKLSGWGRGWEWHVPGKEWGIQSTRMVMMAVIDERLDNPTSP